VFSVVCSAQLSVIVHPVPAVHQELSARCVVLKRSKAGLNNQSKSITSTEPFLIPIALVQYVSQFVHLVVILGNIANKAHPQSQSQS
jgi:hypothetical protein